METMTENPKDVNPIEGEAIRVRGRINARITGIHMETLIMQESLSKIQAELSRLEAYVSMEADAFVAASLKEVDHVVA